MKWSPIVGQFQGGGWKVTEFIQETNSVTNDKAGRWSCGIEFQLGQKGEIIV